MKISKIYVLIAIVALVVALPLSSVLAKRDGQLKMERSTNQQLELKIDSVEKQLEQKNLEQEQIKQENEKLKAEVQAKAELKRKQELAKAEAERARQASVAVSAGGASYSGGGNCESYRGLVSQYGWNVNVALAVMKAESGCNPQAVNRTDNHGVCMGSFGLFQISCHGGQIFDPAQNVAAAWSKYQARGWQPWGVCTSGKVSCF